MADVTVLGAGGATVTIALSSAQTAAAAQLAVNKVNALTAYDQVDVQTQTGAGTLPAVHYLAAAVIFNGTGYNSTTGDLYRLIAATGKGENGALGGKNVRTTVISGDDSNLSYSNQSSNGEVFFGKNTGDITNFLGTLTATTSDGSHGLTAVVGTNSTVNLGAGGNLRITDMGQGLGVVTVNALGSATIGVFGTASTISGAVNMNLTKGSVQIGIVDRAAVINPGAANATILGNGSATSSATLFGGTGSVRVDFLTGSFTGGSAGGNLMRTSSVSGSTTLTGGAGSATVPGDALSAAGAGQTLNAGSGNTTLAAVAVNGATGGSTFNVGTGISTVFGFEGGGNTVNFGGAGISQVLGRNGSVPGAANSYNDVAVYDGYEAVIRAAAGEGGGGQFTIHDFATGLDTLTVKNAFSITFFALGDPANATGSEVTLLQVVGGGSYTFFDSTPDGVQDIFATDVKTTLSPASAL